MEEEIRGRTSLSKKRRKMDKELVKPARKKPKLYSVKLVGQEATFDTFNCRFCTFVTGVNEVFLNHVTAQHIKDIAAEAKAAQEAHQGGHV